METETISVKENPCPCYGGIVQTLTLDSRPRQLPMKVRSCGSQPANISLINRREGVSVSAHARVRKRRDGKKHSGLINPASAEAHHISRLLKKEPAGRLRRLPVSVDHGAALTQFSAAGRQSDQCRREGPTGRRSPRRCRACGVSGRAVVQQFRDQYL